MSTPAEREWDGETTVTLSRTVKKELADYRRDLSRTEGYQVTYNRVVSELLKARRELAKILMADADGGA